MRRELGVALDIGTTTVQGRLLDLKKKKVLSYFSCLNKQLPHGHDIISRIKFCLEKPQGLEKLQRNVISSVNDVIDNLSALAKTDIDDIRRIVAVGNAAMYHFTLSLSPKKLTTPPYEPEYKDAVHKRAGSLGINASGDCEFEFLPSIGGFVGSDAIGVMLAADIDKSRAPALAVDLGTNGEIILGSEAKIWVASTAAGPAFEGWHISCGMRPVEGAIEAVREDGGKLRLKVIGDAAPKGISGSGLIDIIAILLRRSYIEKSGRIRRDFVLRRNGRRIFISQRDVRQVQLAKAALSAGISFLRKAGAGKIARFVITGKFGRRLDIDNARRVGIVPPDIEDDNIEVIEDGALKGACMYLLEKEAASARIRDILRRTEHIPLGNSKNFQNAFTSALAF